MPGDCPSTEQLAAALRGRQSSVADAELSAHLAECARCQARLEEIAGGSGWLRAHAKAHVAAARPAPESLHKAMQALTSRSSSPESETTPSPQLDFLQPTDQPGQLGRFGPYEVLTSVAIGGMGIVLKARDPGLNRIVALKILPPTLAANSLARARFIREARAAAAVVHEHVVPIYAVDECAGLPYLVMQFVHGRTLAERIKASGPLTVEEILRIGAQTAAGLAAAHAQGLIHRDVKPGNILLENGVERVKITDFGLARATDDSSLTRVGYIAGTPEYMAPEQARGETVDERADLFSLGCVLYEMATGISPFRAEKPLVAMRRVCDELPPLAQQVNSKVPDWLSHVIKRLMAKEPAARFQSAAELVNDLNQRLAQFQLDLGQASESASQRWQSSWQSKLSKPLVWMTIAAIVLGVALAIFFASYPASIVESQLRPSLDETNATALALQPEASRFFLPATPDQSERGFIGLKEAIDAAPTPAVVECRFNGVLAVPPIRLVEKPLILRATAGYEPILTCSVPGNRLLDTESALVLEGITVRANGSSESSGARAMDTCIRSMRATFLAAYCRFEADSQGDRRALPEGFLQFYNFASAVIQHCEFSVPVGFAIAWGLDRPPNQNEMPTIELSGSTIHGNLVMLQPTVFASHLILRNNSVSGDILAFFTGRVLAFPRQISASNNIFSVESLIRYYRASELEAKQLLHWRSDSNLYWVEQYAAANSSAAMDSLTDWIDSEATEINRPISFKLGISARLKSLTAPSRANETEAFALTSDELDRLHATGLPSGVKIGADLKQTGPGKPYQEWRNSPAYQEWLKLVRERVPQFATSP